MSDNSMCDARRHTWPGRIDPLQRVATSLRVTATAMLLGLAAGCAMLMPGETAKPAAAPAEKPFAEKPFATVISFETMQLEEPVLFEQAGKMVPVHDVVVVYLRTASVVRFLPKNIEGPVIVLEESPTLPLLPPFMPVWAIVAPRPTIALRDATLWVAPIGSDPTGKDKRSLVTLRTSTQRAHPGDIVSLATVSAAAAAGPTVTVRDKAALVAHVLKRADSLARKER